MITPFPICTKMTCERRLFCKKFANAIDVNTGKVKSGWYIIDKCEYEK